MTYKDYFEEQLIEDAWRAGSHELSSPFICRMSPKLFLSLAQHRINPEALEALPKPDKGGVRWNSLPALAIGNNGETSMVITHDGRHRAIYMIAQGVEEMIVLIHTNQSAMEMCHRVVDEDGEMVYHLPSNVVQVAYDIYSESFEPEPWADPVFGHAMTKAMHQAYFKGGGEYLP